jgi:hypothetical protein
LPDCLPAYLFAYLPVAGLFACLLAGLFACLLACLPVSFTTCQTACLLAFLAASSAHLLERWKLFSSLSTNKSL